MTKEREALSLFLCSSFSRWQINALFAVCGRRSVFSSIIPSYRSHPRSASSFQLTIAAMINTGQSVLGSLLRNLRKFPLRTSTSASRMSSSTTPSPMHSFLNVYATRISIRLLGRVYIFKRTRKQTSIRCEERLPQTARQLAAPQSLSGGRGSAPNNRRRCSRSSLTQRRKWRPPRFPNHWPRRARRGKGRGLISIAPPPFQCSAFGLLRRFHLRLRART